MKSLFFNKEFLSRFLVTLCGVVICLFLYQVNLQGQKSLDPFSEQMVTLFGGLQIPLKLFFLGITPLITGCIFIQILSVFIPYLKRLTFGGAQEYWQLVKITYGVAFVFTVVSSYFLIENMQANDLLVSDSFRMRILLTFVLTGAFVLLVFLGELISRYGLGNGLALIVVTSLVMEVIQGIHSLGPYIDFMESGGIFVCFLLTVILFICTVFYLTTHPFSFSLQKKEEHQEVKILLRYSIVGKVPLIWAWWFILLPATLVNLGYLKEAGWIYTISSSWVSFVLEIILTLVFCFIYAFIIFSPINFQIFYEKFGFEIPGISKEKALKFMDRRLSLALLVAAGLLSLCVLLPYLFSNLGIPPLASSTLLGIKMVMIVGFIADIYSQLQFYYAKSQFGKKSWHKVQLVIGEIEALVIKSSYESQGIPCLVKPIRFTWGMPIRTIFDRYEIYLPNEKESN